MDPRTGPHETMVLYRSDPLLRLLVERLKLPALTIVGLAVTISAASVFGVGAIASYWVHERAEIIRVFDPVHLGYNLVVIFLNIPLVWAVYVWQPRGIASTLRSLRQNDVIVERTKGSFEEFRKRMMANLDSFRLAIAAVLVVLLFQLLETVIVLPAEAQRLGKPVFSFYDKRYYYFFFVPVLSVTYYVVAMVVLKGLLALFWFNHLFREFEARVQPLHPDEAGGFGALGRLAVKYGLISVALGVIPAWVSLVRVFSGSGWAHTDVIVLYAFYIVLVPVCVISPVWSAHKAMARARDELLGEISSAFEQTLRQEKTPDWKTLDELLATYAHIKDTFPTSPIPLAIRRRFSITALVPLLTYGASIVVHLVTKSGSRILR